MTKRARARSISQCFALGEVLSTERQKGTTIQVTDFGRHVAETVIFEHYVECTNQQTFLESILDPDSPDWTDKGAKGEYADYIKLRNPRIDRDAFFKATGQWPDIVTHNGYSWPPGVPMKPPTKQSIALPKQALAGGLATRGRYEYYEIKPDSVSGRDDGIEKLADIWRVMGDPRFGLRYQPGTTYPSPRSVRIEMPTDSIFRKEVVDLQRRFPSISKVSLHMQVRRDVPGLLLYRLCIDIVIEDDNENRAEVMAKSVAKHLYATLLATNMPERYPELGATDHRFDGDRIPRIRCRFDVIEQLKPWQERLSEVIWSRGLAYPGEQFYLCCDERFYLNLVGPGYVAPTAERLWQSMRDRAKTWAEVYGGKAGAALVEKEVLLRAEDIARMALSAYPGLKPMADDIVRWIDLHPYETVAIIMLPFLITAGVAAAVELGVIGGTAAFGEIVAGETLQTAGTLGTRFVMNETTMAQAVPAQVARAGAFRGATTIPAVAKQVAQATGAKVIPITRALQKVAPLTKAAGFPLVGGAVLMGYSVQAHAATNPDQVVADDMSWLYLVKPLATSPGNEKLVPGRAVDLNRIGRTRMAEQIPEYPPRRLDAYYLGKVTVS